MKRKKSQRRNELAKHMKMDVTDPMSQVFGNDVIIRRLEKMLNLADLKNLRLVNRQFSSNVILRTSFTSRVCITVNKDLISSRVLQNLTFPIKVVGVECFRADSSWIQICRNGCVTPYIRRLERFHDLDEEESSRRSWDRIPVPASKVWLAEEIEHIYESLKHVEELKVFCQDNAFSDSCFCDTKFVGSSRLFPSVNRIMQNSKTTLKKLTLRSRWLKQLLEDYDGSFQSCLKEITYLEIYAKTNSKIPQSLVAITKLEFFKIVSDSSVEAEDEAIIEKLIASNVNVLMSLVLHQDNHFACGSIWTRVASLKFSNLRHIDIKFNQAHVQSMLKFLQNHKNSLRSLTLRFMEIRGSVPSEILAMLPTLLNLKEICIFTEERRNEVNLEDLAVLKNCTELHTVKIDMKCYSSVNNGMKLPQLFDCIPVSLRCLGLRGNLLYEGPPLSTLSVRKMINLRSLHLMDCSSAVTNGTLKAIFSSLTNLKEFVLTKANRCSGRGFLGTNSRESASIKDLTDLEKLVLVDCNLNDQVVYKAFEFPKLTLLDISGKNNLTRSLRLGYILTRNPLLEVLCVGTINAIHRKEELIKLKKSHPTLRQFQVRDHYSGKVVTNG